LLFLEPVKFLVSRKDKSQSRRDDVIGRRIDESSVAIERLSERFVELKFSGHLRGWFLDKGHFVSPFADFAILSTADKTSGTGRVPLGGSDPEDRFGRQNRPKPGVATAQAACFVRGLFSRVGACMLFGFRQLRERAAERERYKSARTLRVFQCSV
jgi:hypothetical protein